MLAQMLLAPLLLLSAVQPALAASAQSWSLTADGDGITALHVQSSGGQVKVRGSRDGDVVIKGSRTMGDGACTLTQSRQGHTLNVAVADAAGAPCRIDINLAVPQILVTEIVSEEGNVFVSGLRAPLTLTLSRGNAVVGGTFAKLDARLTHGSLSAQGVGAEATVAIESGNAQLWLDKPRGRASVALDVSQGNVTLTLPQGSVVMDVHVDGGHVQNALPESPDAPITLKGQLGHGNLIVRAAAKSG